MPTHDDRVLFLSQVHTKSVARRLAVQRKDETDEEMRLVMSQVKNVLDALMATKEEPPVN